MVEGLQRFARLVFADETGAGLSADRSYHFSFAIDKTKSRDPDSAELVLYNAAPSTRAFITGPATTVEVYAGRAEPAGRIFRGEITEADSRKSDDMTTWMTTVIAEDNKSKLRTEVISRTFEAGTSLLQAFTDLANAADAQVDARVVDIALPVPVSFLAAPRDAIADLCRRFNLRYQIADQRLLIREPGAPAAGAVVPVVSGLTGLIGAPTVSKEKGKPKVTFTTELNSEIVPGGLVRLETRTIEITRALKYSGGATLEPTRVRHVSEPDPDGTAITIAECTEAA